MSQNELSQLHGAINNLTGKISAIETELSHKPNLWMHIVSVIGCVGAILAVAAIFAQGMMNRNAEDIRDNGKALAALRIGISSLPEMKNQVSLLPQIAESVKETANFLENLGDDLQGLQLVQETQSGNVSNLSRFVVNAFEYVKTAESIDALQEVNGISQFIISDNVVVAARDMEGKVITGSQMREIEERMNSLLQARRASYNRMRDNRNQIAHGASLPFVSPLIDETGDQ